VILSLGKPFGTIHQIKEQSSISEMLQRLPSPK
jgi:hypothetical protein